MVRKRSSVSREIAPEEIFLDASNLPRRDDMQFEGRVVKPIGKRAVAGVGVICVLVMAVFLGRSFELGVVHGSTYAEVSRENRLDRSVLFATRGVVYDRVGREIVWNEITPGSTTPFARRVYDDMPGLSHVVGFVRYPKSDAAGVWWREETTGASGVELAYDDDLAGKNGSSMIEIDAQGSVQSRSIVDPPKNGKDLTLSIDAEVQSKLFLLLSSHADRQGFVGGAAVIMDVETGEIVALTSFPEYDNVAFTEGDVEAVEIASNDTRSPLLDRAISGLYAPGSILKPIFAAAALNENIIDPEKEILSTGAITIPNPYDPSRPSIYRDWTVHGLVDMREAIAVSSDEYFYTIGGGYKDQKGLGIDRIDEYARRFGLSVATGIELAGEVRGVIPTPEWKLETFGEDNPWLLGNTYHTVIGQYGFQVTPIQAVRFTAAIANGGKLLTPQLTASSTPDYTMVGIPDSHLQVVREGMRMAVTSPRGDATVKSLNISGIEIAGKTGTAQVGVKNEWMNSWATGFWPTEHPRYAYAVVLERAPAGTLSGAAPALRPFFEWLVEARPEYVL